MDVLLTCRDCAQSFTFSDDERTSFAARGHTHAPSRCNACREARKSRQDATGGHLPQPGFREFREVRASATCSACGHQTTVPFVVRSDRPVYCSSCFQRRRAASVER